MLWQSISYDATHCIKSPTQNHAAYVQLITTVITPITTAIPVTDTEQVGPLR